MARKTITPSPGVKITKQAVGVPGIDRSGPILAQGAGELFKTMQERSIRKDELAAVARYGDWGMEYGMLKAKLRQDFRDRPDEYPKAARELGEKLTHKHSKGLSSGVGSRFRKITTSAISSDADNNVAWAIGREQEIVVGDIVKGFSDLAYAAEFVTRPEELNMLLGQEGDGFRAEAFTLEAQAVRAKGFLAEKTVEGLKIQNRKLIVSTAMNAAMMNSARQAHADLASGKYDNVLLPTEVKGFLAQSKTMMVNQAIVGQYRSLATASVEVSQMVEGVEKGEVTVADINRRLDWAELNSKILDDNGQPKVSQEYINNLRVARDIALGFDTRSATQKTDDEQAFIQRFHTEWEIYLSSRSKRAKPSPKDYDEVLGLYNKLVRARQSGIVTDDKYYALKKTLDVKLSSNMSKKGKTASLTEALEESGKWNIFNWNQNPRDIYSAGYDKIRKYVDDREDLDVAGKRDLKEQLILSYMDTLQNLPEEKVNEIKQKDKFAVDTLFGVDGKAGLVRKLEVYRDIETGRVYRYGDEYMVGNVPTRVTGIKNGVLTVQTTDDFLKQAGNR